MVQEFHVVVVANSSKLLPQRGYLFFSNLVIVQKYPVQWININSNKQELTIRQENLPYHQYYIIIYAWSKLECAYRLTPNNSIIPSQP